MARSLGLLELQELLLIFDNGRSGHVDVGRQKCGSGVIREDAVLVCVNRRDKNHQRRPARCTPKAKARIDAKMIRLLDRYLGSSGLTLSSTYVILQAIDSCPRGWRFLPLIEAGHR